MNTPDNHGSESDMTPHQNTSIMSQPHNTDAQEADPRSTRYIPPHIRLSRPEVAVISQEADAGSVHYQPPHIRFSRPQSAITTTQDIRSKSQLPPPHIRYSQPKSATAAFSKAELPSEIRPPHISQPRKAITPPSPEAQARPIVNYSPHPTRLSEPEAEDAPDSSAEAQVQSATTLLPPYIKYSQPNTAKFTSSSETQVLSSGTLLPPHIRYSQSQGAKVTMSSQTQVQSPATLLLSPHIRYSQPQSSQCLHFSDSNFSTLSAVFLPSTPKGHNGHLPRQGLSRSTYASDCGTGARSNTIKTAGLKNPVWSSPMFLKPPVPVPVSTSVYPSLNFSAISPAVLASSCESDGGKQLGGLKVVGLGGSRWASPDARAKEVAKPIKEFFDAQDDAEAAENRRINQESALFRNTPVTTPVPTSSLLGSRLPDSRTEITDFVARRMIGSGLGVKLPQKTDEKTMAIAAAFGRGI